MMASVLQKVQRLSIMAREPEIVDLANLLNEMGAHIIGGRNSRDRNMGLRSCIL